MRNFFEKKDSVDVSTNPFAPKQEEKDLFASKKTGNRLNIIDMEVLNSNSVNTELEFMEIRMNNLYRVINENPQNLDPVSLEKMKIEWEELRTKIYNIKTTQNKKTKVKNSNVTAIFEKGFNKIATLIKIYSPKVKHIINTFNDINKDVEELVKGSTPAGEEEMKYRMLVNKIYEASKLNVKLTSEIK